MNVVNEELWEKTKSSPSIFANILSKNLQIALRKRKYSFAQSEAVLAKEKLDSDAKKDKSNVEEALSDSCSKKTRNASKKVGKSQGR